MSVLMSLAVAHQILVITMMEVMSASVLLNLLTKTETSVLISMSVKKQTSNVLKEKFVSTTILLAQVANALRALKA